MAFWGKSFIFDGVSSQVHSLVITSDDSGQSTSNASNAVELKTEDIFRRPKRFLYGVKDSTVLTIPVSIRTTNTELTAEESSLVQTWLFGQRNYKRLQIVQYDMQDYYFNCFLNNPSVVRVGNIIRGYDCDIECDSPFATGFPSTTTYTNIAPETATKYLYNLSEDNGYVYPTLTVIARAAQGTFTITNETDIDGDGNPRVFEYGPTFSGGETLTFDNSLQTISSDTQSVRLLPYFNKNFFRLVPGRNTITFSGDVGDGYIESIAITYSPLKRMA